MDKRGPASRFPKILEKRWSATVCGADCEKQCGWSCGGSTVPGTLYFIHASQYWRSQCRPCGARWKGYSLNAEHPDRWASFLQAVDLPAIAPRLPVSSYLLGIYVRS